MVKSEFLKTQTSKPLTTRNVPASGRNDERPRFWRDLQLGPKCCPHLAFRPGQAPILAAPTARVGTSDGGLTA
jgi:hypothetical protein